MLPQLLHILLDTEYNTPTVFCLADYSTLFQVSGFLVHLQLSQCYIAFACRLRLCNYWLVFGIQQFGTLQFSHHSLLCLSDRLWHYPFGLQHCFTTYRLSTDGTCFRLNTFRQVRVKSNPSLFRWTIAGGSLWETCLWAHCCAYP